MYRQHFNLKKKPFQISSDNEFLWLGKKHSTALEILKNGIAGRQGLLVLTGDVGTGKTTLINTMIHTLDADTVFVKIVDPCLEQHHLFLIIAQALGFEKPYQKGKSFSSNFFSFLKTAGNNNRKVLVIVDEAQRTPDRFLKEIISWSEFDLNKILTVILAGQLEFNDILKTNLGQTWQDNISLHAFLEPLNKEETKTYINKRLELAGADRNIFLPPAVHEIYTYSKGTPRLINIACDQGLIAAFAKGMRVVDAPTIKQELSQLNLPVVYSKNQEKNKKGPLVKIHRINNRQWFLKRKFTWIATAACICLYIGTSFYTNDTPLTTNKVKTLNPPVKTKPLESLSEKPVLPVASSSSIPFKQTEQALIITPQPIITDIQKPAAPESMIEEIPAPSIENKELPQNKTMEDYPVSSMEAEPGAIIDWLFEKNKRAKKD